MKTYRMQLTLTEDGTVTLTNLPFRAGDTVEIVITQPPAVSGDRARYPLWDTPITYKEPTAPVAVEDWEVLK